MWSRRAFFIPDTYLPQAQSASGERLRHADRGGVRESGLLADQLYRSTTKSLAPALRFGFAVDGGGCAGENVVMRLLFRSIPKKCHSGQAAAHNEGVVPETGNAGGDRDARQAAAASEGPLLDAGDAIRNRDARQTGAVREGMLTDAGDTFTNRDARQAFAATEGRQPDAGDAVRDRDARQVEAATEGLFPDRSNRFAFYGVRND